MRTMPAVTLPTVPTLGASGADLNLSMRALMTSLISDALMDMLESFNKYCRLSRQLERDAFEPTEQGTVYYRIAGAQHGAANECRIRGAVQAHSTLELALEGFGKRLLLRGVDRRRRRDHHVTDAFLVVLQLLGQRRNFRDIP